MVAEPRLARLAKVQPPSGKWAGSGCLRVAKGGGAMEDGRRASAGPTGRAGKHLVQRGRAIFKHST